MKIAVLSDAHGNIVFYEKIMRKIKEYSVNKIYYLGDVFGYGKASREILSRLRSEGIYCLLGNHEAMLLGKIPYNDSLDDVYQINEEKSNLKTDEKEYLESLDSFYEINIDGKRILFVHGSPFDPLQGYLYENSKIQIGSLPYDIIFMGHTHRAYMKMKNGILLLNVGSCGLPRDIGNMPSFVLYDSTKLDCEIIRIQIDKEDIKKCCIDVHKSVSDCFLRK